MTYWDLNDVVWQQPKPIETARVLVGTPAAANIVLMSDDRLVAGAWMCTSGEFTTHHPYAEISRRSPVEGRLEHDDGSTIEFRGGDAFEMATEWTGRWIIDETVTATYIAVFSRPSERYPNA